jgi:hypothetical protein
VNVGLHHVEMNNNGTGLSVDSEYGAATINVMVSDSLATLNGDDGIDCKSGNTPAAINVLPPEITLN